MAKDNSDSRKFSRKRKTKVTESTIDESSIKKSKNQTPITKIDALSDDILIEIIKYLPTRQWSSLESVDHRFQRAAYGAWRSLQKVQLAQDLGVDCSKKDEKKKNRKKLRLVLRKLLNRSPHLSSFIFEYEIDVSLFTATCFRLLSQFENLETIDFGKAGVSLEDLANFLETSASRGQLKELNVTVKNEEEKKDKSDDSDDEEENEIYEDILLPAFGHVDSSRPPLRLEKFSFNVTYSNKTYRQKFNSYISGIFGFIDVSRLTTFNISETEIDAVDLISFLNRAVNLENLGFKFITGHHENDVVYFAQNKQILQMVSASEKLLSLKIMLDDNNIFCKGQCQCRGLKGEFLEMIRQLGRKRRLEEFCLTNEDSCTIDIISTIADNMGHLKSLAICPSTESSSCDINLVNLVKKMKGLKKLVFVTNWCLSRPHVFHSDLISAAADITELECLHLGHRIGESRMKVLNRLDALSNLKELSITSGYKLNNSIMKAWANGFGSTMESLEIYSRGVTDVGLTAFVKKAPRLRRLSLVDTEITDAGLRAIAKYCRELRELDFCGDSAKHTMEGVQAIINRCSLLNRLNCTVKEVKIEKYRNLRLKGKDWNDM